MELGELTGHHVTHRRGRLTRGAHRMVTPVLTGAILNYVVLTENDEIAVAMWILHA
jgi:hypothetical protein